ncbi:MAG: ribonuclease HepT family protein, partial [Acidimicrobiales bacterium]
PVRGPAGDRAALEDMLHYASLVRAHTDAGRDSVRDELRLHGVLWELAIIGEAANRAVGPWREVAPTSSWGRHWNRKGRGERAHFGRWTSLRWSTRSTWTMRSSSSIQWRTGYAPTRALDQPSSSRPSGCPTR